MKFEEKYTSARPYAAAYVLLRKGTKIAAVLREHTGFMDGFYGLPSGKIEYDEPYTVGAAREAKEEVGVDINPKDLRFAHACHRHATKDGMFMDWVDIYFEADAWTGEITNAEPDKHSGVDWIELNELPGNIIPYVKYVLQAIARGEAYSEFGWDAQDL